MTTAKERIESRPSQGARGSAGVAGPATCGRRCETVRPAPHHVPDGLRRMPNRQDRRRRGRIGASGTAGRNVPPAMPAARRAPLRPASALARGRRPSELRADRAPGRRRRRTGSAIGTRTGTAGADNGIERTESLYIVVVDFKNTLFCCIGMPIVFPPGFPPSPGSASVPGVAPGARAGSRAGGAFAQACREASAGADGGRLPKPCAPILAVGRVGMPQKFDLAFCRARLLDGACWRSRHSCVRDMRAAGWLAGRQTRKSRRGTV